jgi:hypothetical protein
MDKFFSFIFFLFLIKVYRLDRNSAVDYYSYEKREYTFLRKSKALAETNDFYRKPFFKNKDQKMSYIIFSIRSACQW